MRPPARPSRDHGRKGNEDGGGRVHGLGRHSSRSGANSAIVEVALMVRAYHRSESALIAGGDLRLRTRCLRRWRSCRHAHARSFSPRSPIRPSRSPLTFRVRSRPRCRDRGRALGAQSAGNEPRGIAHDTTPRGRSYQPTGRPTGDKTLSIRRARGSRALRGPLSLYP